MSNFNNQLKTLRQEYNLSQQELADKIGISKSSINMYERGEREPGIETVKRIADFFNVDVDYLFGVSDIKKRREFKVTRTNKSIAHNIRHHREQSNLSQKELADLLGIDEAVVADLESSKSTLKKDMLYKICDVLHLIPSNIMPRDDEEFTEDEEYLLSRREKNSPDQLPLSEGEKILLDLFRQIPEDQQRVFLEMGRVYANSLKKD